MAQAQFCIELDWQSFDVDMNTVETWMKANAGASYCGNCSSAKLELWFQAEPEQAVKDAISAYWSGLTAESPEATNYKTQAQREADAASATASAKASAQTKLAALGLTADEIAAVLGN